MNAEGRDYFTEWTRIRERHGRAFAGAFNRGYESGKRGEPRSAPYADDGRTFSTAFARFWLQGYDIGISEK